uniref:Uncharacterized protein n=1 Tax=Alexandrium monilatum TaxID=311494 RepID=A0A7S4R0X0_9DINO
MGQQVAGLAALAVCPTHHCRGCASPYPSPSRRGTRSPVGQAHSPAGLGPDPFHLAKAPSKPEVIEVPSEPRHSGRRPRRLRSSELDAWRQLGATYAS